MKKSGIFLLAVIIIGVVVFLFVKNNQQKLLSQCTKQAEIVLENEQKNKLDPSDTFNQTNHYNNKLRKCIVKITANVAMPDSVIFQTEIKDAYEGKSFIICYSGALNFCVIPADASSSGEPIRMNNDEGEKIIQDYMNN